MHSLPSKSWRIGVFGSDRLIPQSAAYSKEDEPDIYKQDSQHEHLLYSPPLPCKNISIKCYLQHQ